MFKDCIGFDSRVFLLLKMVVLLLCFVLACVFASLTYADMDDA